MASTPERWEWLQSAYRTYQTVGIDDCYLVTPEEVREKCPIMDTTGVLGGLWADRRAMSIPLAPFRPTQQQQDSAALRSLNTTRSSPWPSGPDGSWDVMTERGTVHTEHVINAGGLWAKQVGRMVGLDLPLSPLEHHYLLTETIPEVEAMDFELPMTVDLEGFTYMRQDQNGILVGIYEINHQHWNIDGAPWDYGIELIQENTDRIADELEMAFNRYRYCRKWHPDWVNGAFTFSPDGNPLVGPVSGVPTTGSPAVLWPASFREVAWARRSPSG
ncbi:MAG: hypothetical protein CM1200mP20_05750 [Pseudomonadota bacterium]|nr:MAG: hypothetical protein CM1200mP20_05750 [Pseudomonadota bacterium]